MSDKTAWPWDKKPEPLEDRFQRLKSDVGVIVTHTCVIVRSPHPALGTLQMNVQRASEVPVGKVTFADGTTVEFCNIGMPQPGVKFGSVSELVTLVYDLAEREGLKL